MRIKITGKKDLPKFQMTGLFNPAVAPLSMFMNPAATTAAQQAGMQAAYSAFGYGDLSGPMASTAMNMMANPQQQPATTQDTNKKIFRESNYTLPSMINAGMSMFSNMMQGIDNYNTNTQYAKELGQSANFVAAPGGDRGNLLMNTGTPGMITTPVPFAGRPVREYMGYPAYYSESMYGPRNRFMAQGGALVPFDIPSRVPDAPYPDYMPGAGGNSIYERYYKSDMSGMPEGAGEAPVAAPEMDIPQTPKKVVITESPKTTEKKVAENPVTVYDYESADEYTKLLLSKYKKQLAEKKVAPEAIIRTIPLDFTKEDVSKALTPLGADEIVDFSGKVKPGRFNFGDIKSLKGFIFHHTAGRGTPEGVVETFHQRNFPAHFIIDRNGKVYQTLAANRKGQHIKEGTGTGSGLNNSNTLGVEIIAHGDADILPAQLISASRLAKTFGFGPDQVFSHADVNKGHKMDEEGMTARDFYKYIHNIRTTNNPYLKNLPKFEEGGEYYEGDEYELSEDEINNILKNGGEIEYL